MRRRKYHLQVEHIRRVCRRSQSYAAFCKSCGADADLITFQEAASVVGARLDTIIKYAAKGKLHIGVRPEAMLVCLNSLLRVDELSFAASVH